MRRAPARVAARAGKSRRLLDTVYSLSSDVPPHDAATDSADDSALERGAVAAGSIRRICFIRKIASGGAVLHADMPVEEGRRLELELPTGEHLDGTIVWRRGCEVGLRFDEPIDVLPILARNLASQPGERRRMPRVELFCRAAVQTATGSGLATIRDIAQGGVKLDVPFALAPDERVTVTPEGLRPVEGIVRWASGQVAGIAFEPEIEWQELMPWLRARRTAQPPERAPEMPAPGPDASSGRPPAQESVQLNLPARVREGTRRWTIDVTSLTARSVEFDCYAALRLGTLLWIVLPGLEGWPARIVAVEGYRFTCEFPQALHPAVLERILASAKGADSP